MKILATRFAVVTIEDDTKRQVEVLKQGDGKWKCLSCNRYRCDHVKFVQSQNVVLPEKPPATTRNEDDEILTY